LKKEEATMRQALSRVPDYQAIPAHPGYKVHPFNRVQSQDPQGHAPIFEHSEPVIAWCYYRMADGQGGFTWRLHPITTASPSPAADGFEYLIEYPDGRVLLPFVDTFANFDEAVEFLKQDSAKEAEPSPLQSLVRD